MNDCYLNFLVSFRALFSLDVGANLVNSKYGIMNMTGVFAGAAVTQLLGKWTDGGSLGEGFAMLSIVVALALGLQIYFLRPKTDNME